MGGKSNEMTQYNLPPSVRVPSIFRDQTELRKNKKIHSSDVGSIDLPATYCARSCAGLALCSLSHTGVCSGRLLLFLGEASQALTGSVPVPHSQYPQAGALSLHFSCGDVNGL